MTIYKGQSLSKTLSGLKKLFNLKHDISLCRPINKCFGTGNDNDKEIIIKSNNPQKKHFPTKRKRIISPTARLSHILPLEHQATGAFDSHKDEDSKRTDNNDIEFEGKQIPENSDHASQFHFEWSEPNPESIGKNITNPEIYIKNIDDERKTYRQTYRKRTLSPLQRLSGHLAKDLLSDLADKETVESPSSDFTAHSFDNLDNSIKLQCESEVTDVPKIPPQTFQYNCFVVLYLFGWTKGPKEYKYMFELEKGKFFHVKSYGKLSHDELLHREPGQIIKIVSNKMALISFPTLEDFITLMPKKLVAANPKTVSSMIYQSGILEGSKVLEAGSGAGGTTLLLSRAVGSSGHVYSMEKEEVMSGLAQENVDKWNKQLHQFEYATCHNISFLYRDITKPFDLDLHNIDAVFLDMKNPFDALANVSRHLSPGSVILVYTPSVSTVLSCVQRVQSSCPLLRVEGVFEDKETLWKVRGQLSENKCQPYKRDERQTVFILKMIKTKDASQQCKSDNAQEVPGTPSSRFNYGDYVCVEYLNQKSKGKKILCVTKLSESGQLALPQRNLQHSDVVGMQPGSVLRVKQLPPLLVTSPTLETFVETLPGNRGLLSLQHYRLICHALDIKKGDTVLHMGRQRNQCTASAAYFSQTVGETGQVFCVTGSEEVSKECEKSIETWREITCRRARRDLSLKILLEGERHHVPSDIHFDGISTDLQINSLVKNLHFISARLKIGKCAAVFFPSVTSIIQLEEYLKESVLPLHIKQVYEEREREWIVQPVKMNNPQDDLKYDENNWPYVCRPKQKTTCSNSGFIGILQKAIQLE